MEKRTTVAKRVAAGKYAIVVESAKVLESQVAIIFVSASDCLKQLHLYSIFFGAHDTNLKTTQKLSNPKIHAETLFPSPSFNFCALLNQ